MTRFRIFFVLRVQGARFMVQDSVFRIFGVLGWEFEVWGVGVLLPVLHQQLDQPCFPADSGFGFCSGI